MRPETEADVADIIASAKAPVSIRGGATRGVATEGDRLETGGLSGVTLYEPGALTLVAQAGTPLAEVEATLAAEGQRLPFEPYDARPLLGTDGEPTIGGVVATNASGPRRIQAGACRDSLIGVRFVDGTGQTLKNGGRVMKNVTGYDLVKLMAGAHGTLGILTEVSFKVLPAPEATSVLLFEGLSDDDAVAAMSAALGSPYEVSGAAHAPKGTDGTPITMLRLEGFGASVAYRAEALSKALAAYGNPRVENDPVKNSAVCRWVRDAEAFAAQTGDVWRVSVKPSDGPGVSRRVGGQALYDWGGGLVWLLVSSGTDVRAKLGDLPGHATLIRAASDTVAALGRFHPEPAPLATLAAGLREKFDPRGLLNPGLMG